MAKQRMTWRLEPEATGLAAVGAARYKRGYQLRMGGEILMHVDHNRKTIAGTSMEWERTRWLTVPVNSLRLARRKRQRRRLR